MLTEKQFRRVHGAVSALRDRDVFCAACGAQRGADLRYPGAPLYNAGHLYK